MIIHILLHNINAPTCVYPAHSAILNLAIALPKQDMSDVILQVKDLKTYFYTTEGVVRAVDGVSYDVREAETVALVGESGCGKSVSALSIIRLVPYPGRIVGGQIIFDGEDLLRASEDKMRGIRGKHIGMIFQEPMTSLNPVMTIGEQIAEPLRVHLKMDRKTAQQRVV